MARYKAPTIAERGGLEAYMGELGVDYKLLCSLRTDIGDRYGAIADALTKKAKLKKPLRPQRVKHWCRVADQELEDAQRASTAN